MLLRLAIFAIHEGHHRDRSFRHPWRAGQRRPCGASGFLPLCSLLRPGSLGQRESEFILTHDKELPVGSSVDHHACHLAYSTPVISIFFATGYLLRYRRECHPLVLYIISQRKRSPQLLEVQCDVWNVQLNVTALTVRGRVCFEKRRLPFLLTSFSLFGSRAQGPNPLARERSGRRNT